jgi:hypothetical protein
MKYKFTTFLFLLSLLPIYGQTGGRITDNEQIKAQRATYITQRLKLTAEEATYFWSNFNDYELERAALEEAFAATMIPKANTEAEAAGQIEARFQLDENLLALRRSFYERVKDRVPSTKLVLLPQVEREFKKSLLQRLEQRKQQGGRSFNRRG